MKWLQGRAWPGDVRVLEGFIERRIIRSPGPRLEVEEELSVYGPGNTRAIEESAIGVALSLEEAERRHIVATLERVSWRIEGPAAPRRL